MRIFWDNDLLVRPMQVLLPERCLTLARKRDDKVRLMLLLLLPLAFYAGSYARASGRDPLHMNSGECRVIADSVLQRYPEYPSLRHYASRAGVVKLPAKTSQLVQGLQQPSPVLQAQTIYWY